MSGKYDEMVLEGTRGHFQGKQLSHFHFCLPSLLESTLKGKHLLHLEQMLSVKLGSVLEGFRFLGIQTGSHKN